MLWLQPPLIRGHYQLTAFKVLLHIGCLGPALWLFWQGVQDQLGADPVKALVHFYGIGAIHCLFATLLASVLAKWLKTPAFIQCRRLLGLYVFFYSSCHLLTFMALEWQWQWSEIGQEIIKRPYMSVGMLAWLLTLVLALTSFKKLQHRLGERWLQLHALVYPLFSLALLHFYWSQKSPWNQAIIYALLGIALLGLKRKRVWLWFELFRQNQQNR